MPYRFNPISQEFDWVNPPGVTGPVSSTPQAIARYLDNTGQIIEDSPGTLVQDGGAIEAQAIITDRQVSDTVNVPTNYTMITDSIEMQPGGVITMNPGSKIIIL